MTLSFVGLSFSAPFVASVRPLRLSACPPPLRRRNQLFSSSSAPFVASSSPPLRSNLPNCGGVAGRYGDSFSGDAEQGEEYPLFLVFLSLFREIVYEYNVYEHMVITKIKDGVNVAASHTLISGGLAFGVGVFALKSVLKFRCGGKVSKL
ncbi:hypothetical protein Bca101_099398 [Brassica carinata]